MGERAEASPMDDILHPGLGRGDYDTRGGLAAVASWRARTLVGNSPGAGRKVGAMEAVGYVLVPLAGPFRVIPVSRGDEHHRGLDLLWRKAADWRVDPAVEWFPIYAPSGNGLYLRSPGEVPRALAAARRWRRAGGPNLTAASTGAGAGWAMPFDDLLACGGDVAVYDGRLLPLGERFAAALDELSDGLGMARHGRELAAFDRRALRKVADASAALVAALRASFWELGLCAAGAAALSGAGGDAGERLDWLEASLAGAVAEGDLRLVEELVFAWGGVKNAVHDALRRERDGGRRGRLATVFGDLGLADDRLGGAVPAPDGESAAPAPRPR
jgi:hypothetical protein